MSKKVEVKVNDEVKAVGALPDIDPVLKNVAFNALLVGVTASLKYMQLNLTKINFGSRGFMFVPMLAGAIDWAVNLTESKLVDIEE